MPDRRPRRLVALCLCSCLAMVLPVASARAAQLQVQGSWQCLLGDQDLGGGAGSDLLPVHTSAVNAVVVSVINTAGLPWTMSLRRAAEPWPAGLTIGARRTGDGVGAFSPMGGGSFTLVDDTDQMLMQGRGDVLRIPLQLQLRGASIQLGTRPLTARIVLRLEGRP
jgi:hypothetical protein